MSQSETDSVINQARAAIDAGECLEAIPSLLPLAEGGNMEAQFLLGYMYFADCDYPFPDHVARSWLMKAREQGDANASYQLAWFSNEEGHSSITSIESMNFLIEAGERGCVDAQRDLGAYYATGEWAGEKDEAKAVEWYTRAALQGHAMAQFDLGFMLLLGEGAAQDTAKGLEWLVKSADQGFRSSGRLLADIYREGVFGVPADPEKARHWEETGRNKVEI